MTTTQFTQTNTASFNSAVQEGAQHPMLLDLSKPVVPQVIDTLKAVDVRRYEYLVPVGQSAAAISMVAMLDLATKFRTAFFQFGSNKLEASFDLFGWRQNVISHQRPDLSEVTPADNWLLVDCLGRGVPEADINAIEESLAGSLLELPDGNKFLQLLANYRLDNQRLDSQAQEIVDAVLTVPRESLKAQKIAMIPPGSGQLAILVATAIYGLTEVWPRIVRRADMGSGFEVAEVINIQAARQQGVEILKAWNKMAQERTDGAFISGTTIEGLAALLKAQGLSEQEIVQQFFAEAGL